MVEVKERIVRACTRARRNPDEVQLVAVSKGQSIEAIQQVFDLGQRDFGESYASEFQQKHAALSHLPIRWHFIGRLQSNKLRLIVPRSRSIQSLCRLSHCEKIIQFHDPREPFGVYIAVNLGAEPQKEGLLMQEVPGFLAQLRGTYPTITVEGLMAIPPKAMAESSSLPPAYLELGATCRRLGLGLSLGMSGDLEHAIMAGSNMVRIGTDLFGARRL